MPEIADSSNLFIKTLTWITGKLDSLGIPYMVTGGSAVGFWGQVRTTMDIDILIKISGSTPAALVTALRNEAYISEEDVSEAASGSRMFNVIFNETSFKVDFVPLNENDAYEKEKFSRRKKINFAGGDLWVISPEDLILSKLTWMKSAGGSERQLLDCRSIMEISKNLDSAYLKKWAQILGVDKELGDL